MKRIRHGKPGAGPDRSVAGAHRIAQQDEVAMRPSRIAHDHAVEPERAVGEQRLTLEPVGEDALAIGAALVLAQALQAGALPGLWRAFGDEARLVLGVAVRV